MAQVDLPTHGAVLKTHHGNFVPNPLVGHANMLRRDVQRLATEFGLSPFARTAMSARLYVRRSWTEATHCVRFRTQRSVPFRTQRGRKGVVGSVCGYLRELTLSLHARTVIAVATTVGAWPLERQETLHEKQARSSRLDRRRIMPTPAQLRSACYALIAIAKTEADPAVRRILAAHAFTLAQQAQMQSWVETERAAAAQ